MVDESTLTTYSKSSSFVQTYALGKGLLSDEVLESDIVFTGPMVILLDALVRTKDPLPFDELEAGTGLGKSDLRSAVDICEDHGLIILEGGGISLNDESDIVQIIRDVHKQS